MPRDQETIDTLRKKNQALERKLQYLETVIELHNICTFEEGSMINITE